MTDNDKARWHWECGLCGSSSESAPVVEKGSDTRREAEQLLKRHLRERCESFDVEADIEAECTVYKEG